MDRTPPEIVFTLPQQDSLNQSTHLSKIEIRFSERMDQASLNNHIYISPPVAFEKEWDGWKNLELHLKDTLRDSQTYVVVIGAGAKDLQKNSMKASYQFAFSTGSYIDKGSITGKVYGLKKDNLPHIFAYALTDTHKVNPTLEEPLYISQSGPDGRYKLDYLKMGVYRIFAVEDQNHNFLVDTDMERVGISFYDARLDSLRPVFTGLDFRMTRNDTTPPKTVSARSVNRTTVHVRFSEPVDLFPEQDFLLTDSISGEGIKLLGYSRGLEQAQTVELFTDSLDSAAVYLLQVPAIKDSSANVNDSRALLSFQGSGRKDTTGFRLLEHLPKDSTKNIMPGVEISLRFSNPVDTFSLQKAYRLISLGKDTIAGAWIFPTLYQARFRPLVKLNPDSSYFSSLNLNQVRNLWGKRLADSLQHHYFTVVSSRELGELSGEVVTREKTEAPVYINVRSLKRGVGKVRIKTAGNKAFYVAHLQDGNYLLDGFLDLNRDGKFSAGRLQPFQYSEPFCFCPDTVKVRKRWETSGVQFTLPGGNQP